MNTCGKCAYMNGDGFCRLLSKPRGYFDTACESWCEELPKFNKFMSKEETTRTCKACGRELPLEDFPKDAHGGHIHTCKECHAERLHARRRPGTPRAGLKKVKKDSRPEGKAKTQPPVPADDPKIAEEIAAAEVEAQEVPTCCSEATDQELFDELRKRGWEGYLVKTMSTRPNPYPANVSFASRIIKK